MAVTAAQLSETKHWRKTKEEKKDYSVSQVAGVFKEGLWTPTHLLAQH